MPARREPPPDIVRQHGRMLTPGEVADLLGVDPKTVSRWVKQGKLRAVRATPRGHHRFREEDIRAILDGRPRGGYSY